MAPRETPKATPKVQRTIKKNAKAKASPVSTIKKTISSRKKNTTEKTLSVNNTKLPARPRTSTVPKMSTPKSKENRSVPASVKKSVKKSWNRRPKAAHSGVPVPEEMKKISGEELQDSDCSL